MSEFRRVSTLDVSSLEVWIGDGTVRVDCHGNDCRSHLTVAQAKTLRDWLTSALPCEHQRRFTGAKRVDPFGKSDATIKVTNECMDCGYVPDTGEKHG